MPSMRPLYKCWCSLNHQNSGTDLNSVAKMVQMAASNQAIPSIVPWASDDQHHPVRRWRKLCPDSLRDAEASQLHELVHTEAQGTHELLIHSLRLLLAPG